MFLTNVLFKKAKAKHVLVWVESVVSGHRYVKKKERLGPKLEMIKFDPLVQMMSVYKEAKKIKSIRPKSG